MAIPGELVVTDDVPGAFAERVVQAFHGRPLESFSIALSGGDTARACYERLAEGAATQIDWWKVDVYWGDERCVPHDDVESNYRLAREALLDRVGAANATHPALIGSRRRIPANEVVPAGTQLEPSRPRDLFQSTR